MAKYKGGCLCGKIKYAFDGEPDEQMQITCHCDECRKITGAGHARSMGVARELIHWNGEPKVYQIQHEKSVVDTAFCSDCGSPLYKITSGLPQLVFLHVGSLDPECSQDWRTKHLAFADRRQAWDLLD